jgi:hypothetical protein
MPTTRRRRTRRPAPADFAAIGAGERIRWRLGAVLLDEDFSPRVGTEGGAPPVSWPSWAAWAEVYGRCRADFLARFPGHLPGAERLFVAFQSGGDAGADAEARAIAAEARAEQGRLYAGLGK